MSTEIAISLNFKYTPGDQEVVDARDGTRHDVDNLDTKILVYENRVNGWFIRWAEDLLKNGNADYVVLQVALAQIEGMEQFWRGESSARHERPDNQGKSKEFFVAAMRRILAIPVSAESSLEKFYSALRCGLFHVGFTRGVVLVSRKYTDSVDIQGDRICINAEKFLADVKAGFQAYVSELKDPTNTTRRDNFEKLWNQHWADAKDPLAQGLPVWPWAPSAAGTPP